MRLSAGLPLLAMVGALAACGPRVPDQGVGFDDYQSYLRERELNGGSGAATGGTIAGPAVSSAPLDASGAPVGGMDNAAERPRAAASVGISDEQNFKAVSSRETIQSDRERIERNRAQYQVISAKPLPQRNGSDQPNIVEYALQSTNRVGEPVYSRINPMRESLAARACAKFASPDLAQEAFLKAGGPERDSKSLDPDGDGYACSWDPAPFRKALR